MDPVGNLSAFAGRLFVYKFINKDKTKKQKTHWIKTVINDCCNAHIPCQW